MRRCDVLNRLSGISSSPSNIDLYIPGPQTAESRTVVAGRPWLAAFREHPSYSTDTSKSAAFFVYPRERVACAIACIDGIPSIGAEYRTSWASCPCHVG